MGESMSSLRLLTVIATVTLLVLSGLILTPGSSAQVSVEKTFHYNMKSGNDLSTHTYYNDDNEEIQRVNADYDDNVIGRSNRRQVNVGDWTTAEGVGYDYGINGQVTFNLFYREIDEGYNNDPDWEWTLTINDQDYGPYSTTGPNDDSGAWMEVRLNANPGVQLMEGGFTLSLNIKYTGWEDVEIAYDSPTHPSGFYLTGDPIGAFDGSGYQGTTAILEFTHPYEYDVKDALRGNFIQLVIDGAAQDNNLSELQSGKSYEWRNTTVTTGKIIWTLAEPIPAGAKIRVDFALGPVGNPSMSQPFNFTLKEGIGGGSTGGDSPSLGLVASLGAVTLGLLVTTLRRRD